MEGAMKPDEYISELLDWNYDEIVSPREFLQICANDRQRIRNVKFLLPGVGPGRFGSFAVEYKAPKKVRK
jgi:hypothetical protein